MRAAVGVCVFVRYAIQMSVLGSVVAMWPAASTPDCDIPCCVTCAPRFDIVRHSFGAVLLLFGEVSMS